MKKLLFIYNPASGKGVIKRYVDSLIEIFEDYGYFVDILRIQEGFEGNSGRAVAQREIDYDRVICSGGDGTLSRIVSSLMLIPEERRPVIGFIPTGSTNDMGKNLDLPKLVMKAGKMVMEGEPMAMDIGRLEDQYFAYVVSMGELSAVSAFTSPQAKKVLGRGAYITEGLKVLMKMDSNHIVCRYDKENVIEGDFILGMIANSTSVGGFKGIMGNSVDLSDGMFEAAFVRKPSNLNEFSRELDAMLVNKDESNKVAGDLVERFKASEIDITSPDDVQWVKDGENAGRHAHVLITNENKAIRIITGPALWDEEEQS